MNVFKDINFTFIMFMEKSEGVTVLTANNIPVMISYCGWQPTSPKPSILLIFESHNDKYTQKEVPYNIQSTLIGCTSQRLPFPVQMMILNCCRHMNILCFRSRPQYDLFDFFFIFQHAILTSNIMIKICLGVILRMNVQEGITS